MCSGTAIEACANKADPLLTVSMMKLYLPAIILGLIIAAVWGYFSDLRNDQLGWFIGRLVFVPVVLVVVQRLFASRGSDDK